jgi:hypothetical protein
LGKENGNGIDQKAQFNSEICAVAALLRWPGFVGHENGQIYSTIDSHGNGGANEGNFTIAWHILLSTK